MTHSDSVSEGADLFMEEEALAGLEAEVNAEALAIEAEALDQLLVAAEAHAIAEAEYWGLEAELAAEEEEELESKELYAAFMEELHAGFDLDYPRDDAAIMYCRSYEAEEVEEEMKAASSEAKRQAMIANAEAEAVAENEYWAEQAALHLAASRIAEEPLSDRDIEESVAIEAECELDLDSKLRMEEEMRTEVLHMEIEAASAHFEAEDAYWAREADDWDQLEIERSRVDRSLLLPLRPQAFEDCLSRELDAVEQRHAEALVATIDHFSRSLAALHSHLAQTFAPDCSARAWSAIQSFSSEEVQVRCDAAKALRKADFNKHISTHDELRRAHPAAVLAAGAVFGASDLLLTILDQLRTIGTELTSLDSYARYGSVSRAWQRACRELIQPPAEASRLRAPPFLGAPIALEQSIEVKVDAMCLLPTNQLCVAIFYERQCRLYDPENLDAALYDTIELPLVDPSALARLQPLLGVACSDTHLHVLLAHPDPEPSTILAIDQYRFSLYTRPHLYAWDDLEDGAGAEIRRYTKHDLETSGIFDHLHVGQPIRAGHLHEIGREQRIAAHGPFVFLACRTQLMLIRTRGDEATAQQVGKLCRSVGSERLFRPSISASNGKLYVTHGAGRDLGSKLLAKVFGIRANGSLSLQTAIDLAHCDPCPSRRQASTRFPEEFSPQYSFTRNACGSSTDGSLLYVTGDACWQNKRSAEGPYSLHVLRCTKTHGLVRCRLKEIGGACFSGPGFGLGLGAICSGGGRVYVAAPDAAFEKRRMRGHVACALSVTGSGRVQLMLHNHRWSLDLDSPKASRIYVVREAPPAGQATGGADGRAGAGGTSGGEPDLNPEESGESDANAETDSDSDGV